MAIGVSMYKDLLKNKTYDDLVEYLKEQEKYLISDELKKAREEEIKMGIDDNNCISNVENEIIAIKELLQEKTLEKYKKIDNVELQEILNLIESNPRFVDGIRLLSKEEVVNYKTEYNLSIDNIIPLIDLYDNEFVVYNLTTNKFNILDISDEFIRESENIKNYIEKLKSNEADTSKGMLRKYKIDENGNMYEEEIELNFQPDPTNLYIMQIKQKLNMDSEEVYKNSKRLDDVKATYYWNSSRGGTSIIVADDGSYLGATSAVNFDKHLEEFKNGRRNGNFNVKNTKILKINCHSCNNELEIDCSKYPSNVKTLDTMCPNCKSMIKFGNLNYINDEKNSGNTSANINTDYLDKIVKNICYKHTEFSMKPPKYELPKRFFLVKRENRNYIASVLEHDVSNYPNQDNKTSNINSYEIIVYDLLNDNSEIIKIDDLLKDYKLDINVNYIFDIQNKKSNLSFKEQLDIKRNIYSEFAKIIKDNNYLDIETYNNNYLPKFLMLLSNDEFNILTKLILKEETIFQYNEKIKINEISAIETIGNPNNKKENTILLVSSDYAVIDNQRYNLHAQNKIEIDNIIKNNMVEIKKIVQQQTPEFLTSHVAINNTSKYFYVKLLDDSIKINYQTGTESDDFIKKLIDEISGVIVSKINNSKGLREIIDNIFSKLTGNTKEDIDYLNKISEEYKSHPLSKEILREIGRKIYDLLPENEKTEMNNAYNEDMLNIHKIIDEAGKYIFGKEKNLSKAKEILLDFLDKNNTLYNDDSETEYHNFNDVIEFTTYIKKYKPEKNIKWIDFPFITIYSYLAYIYNEERNCDEALKMIEKAIKWNPMSLSPLFEKCETYKFQKKWGEFKNNTELLYDKIFNASDLAHYYRNLGFYYIETNKLDLAYALYTASLKFEKTTNAVNEMMYINKQLKREKYNMSAEEGLTLLKENNISFGPKQENLDLLVSIYETEKELIKNPVVELLLASRIYYLTKDNRFAPFYEMLDKTTACSILIPRSWKPLKDEEKNSFGPNNMFAIYTDSNALFQANYDGKCSLEQFNDAYNLNINNIKNSNQFNSKLLKETSLILNLQQGPKEFKNALFEVESNNKTIRIYHYFTIINGMFVDFSISVSNEIDYTNDSKFNNQKNIQDLVNVLSSIIEVDNKTNNTKNPFSNTTVNNLINKIDNQLIELTKQEFEEINIVYKNNKNISRIFDFADNTFKKAKDNDPFWIQSSKEALIYVLVNLIETNNSLRYDDLRNIMNDKSKFIILCKNPKTSLENIELNKIIDRLLKANDKMLDDFYSIIMENLNIINPKEETYVCNIKFNNESNFTLIIPRTLGELVRHNDTTFKIGNNLNIMKAKCNNVESLKKRADEWLKNSADTNGQTILENLGKEYFLKNNQLSVIYKVVEKESKKRYYKFVYYNELMLIFGYSNEKVDKVIDDIIESIKAIKEQEKIERNPFEDPNLKSEINSSDLKVDIIKELYNNDTIKLKLFGKEREIQIFSTRDNKFDETGNYKSDDFKLNNEELDVLNWFISNIKIEDYKKEIMDYCNNEYSSWSYADGTQEGPIGIADVENEVDIRAIAINVTENWKANDGFVYPEISFYGECKCDEEHGICIGFRNKKFLGIHSQDWTL